MTKSKETAPDLSDFDEVAALGKRARCKIAIALQELPPERVASLEAALVGDYYGSVIATTLGKWGIKVGSDAVNHHRRGRCGCGR